jgi:transcription elongation GreA/GreB family factor
MQRFGLSVPALPWRVPWERRDAGAGRVLGKEIILMSRAFMKELEDLPQSDALPESVDPRPITAAGLRALRARIGRTPAGPARDELERLATRVFVPPAPPDPAVASFGSAVTIEGPDGDEQTYTIVGEDEIEIEKGRVGADSPLAQALIGKRAGDSALWKRPKGDRKMRVRSVTYAD